MSREMFQLGADLVREGRPQSKPLVLPKLGTGNISSGKGLGLLIAGPFLGWLFNCLILTSILPIPTFRNIGFLATNTGRGFG